MERQTQHTVIVRSVDDVEDIDIFAFNSEAEADSFRTSAYQLLEELGLDDSYTVDEVWHVQVTTAEEAYTEFAGFFEEFAHDMEAEHEHPCKDIEEGLGCEACSAFEQQMAESVGHPEACSYTMKATYQEAIDHFLYRTPECDGFGVTCERCGSTIPPERHQPDCPIAAQYADADESLMGYAL